jgi:hypothetical protein
MNRQHKETHQTWFEKWGKERGGNGNIMEGVNLFKNTVCIYTITTIKLLILLMCPNSKMK